MAYVFRTKKSDGKYHPKYRFQYTDWQGKRRTATGTTSKAETARVAAQLEAEHDLIRKGLRPPPKTSTEHGKRPFAEVREEYLAWGLSQGGRRGKPWGKEHARKRTTHLSWWQEELRLEALEDLEFSLGRVETAMRQLQAEGRAGKTLHNYTEAITSFAKWCVARGYLEKNPFTDLAKFDVQPKTVRRAMTKDEISRVLKAAPLHRRLLYETAFCSGLRAGELRALRADDLDVERQGLRLHAEWTKNRRDGFQPLPRALVTRLATFHASGEARERYERAYLRCDSKQTAPDDPLLFVPGHAARALDLDLDRAGVSKVTDEGKVDFHACRTAYVTLLINAGAGLKEAQSLARHSTARLTMDTYARAQGSRLTELSEAVGAAVLLPKSTTCAQRKNRPTTKSCKSARCRTEDGGSTPPASILLPV